MAEFEHAPDNSSTINPNFGDLNVEDQAKYETFKERVELYFDAVPGVAVNKCHRCGNPPHDLIDCPGRNVVCRNCKCTGHFDRWCQNEKLGKVESEPKAMPIAELRKDLGAFKIEETIENQFEDEEQIKSAAPQLVLFKDSTPEEILRMHCEDPEFQNSPKWLRFLSSKTMAALEMLVQNSPKLRSLVNSCLLKGQELIIDLETVSQYPVEDNHRIYASYGETTTKIAFDSVCGLDFPDIIKLFPNIEELRIINVKLREPFTFNNYTLRKLFLIDTGSSDFQIPQNIESLHLQGNGYIYFNKCYSNLKSLTLINKDIICYKISFPALNSLTMDYCWRGLEYERIKEFSKLEHLKIIQGVDGKFRTEIEALKLKSCDVYYWEIPIEQNLILNLNNDCLVHLSKYLSVVDWDSLQQLHPKLQNISGLRFKYTIEGTHIGYSGPSLQDNRRFYERIGPLVTNISVCNVTTTDFCTLMPFFTNLKTMYLYTYRLDYIEADKYAPFIPNGLRDFHFGGQMSADVAVKLYRRLNPTLRKYTLEYEYKLSTNINYGLNELHNIQEFKCSLKSLSIKIIEFLTLNKDNMRHLDLYIDDMSDDSLVDRLWLAITQMRNLSSLSINSVITADTRLGLMVDLVKLTLFYSPADHLIPCILKLTKLKELSVAVQDGNLLPLIKGLPNLVMFEGRYRLHDENIIKEIKTYLTQTKHKLRFVNGSSDL